MSIRTHRAPSFTAGALALLAASFYTVQAQAATITVGAEGTVGAVNVVDGDGTCSLVGAITNANADNQSGDIDCAAGSGADTIVLPAGATFTLTTALPLTGSTIVVEGHGSTIRRSSAGGTPNFAVVTLNTGSDLSLKDLTLTGGTGGIVANFKSSDPAVSLSLERCAIVGNTRSGSASGGGILFTSTSGQFLMKDSLVSGNSALGSSGDGGGLSLGGTNATMTIRNSTVSGNSAISSGAGISLGSGSLTVENSTITGNASRFYGGIYVATGALTLRNSIVSGNTGTNTNGTFRVHEIGSNAGAQAITSSNNVLGQSDRTFAAAFDQFTPGATDKIATSNGGSTGLHVPTALTSILNTTLASNGGPTQTHALVADSPAVNASGTGATETDQRGFIKAQGDTVRDIGAFELNGVAPPPPVVAINGTCGEANGSATSLAPSGVALCATGTATEVLGKGGAWGWSCTGSDGGTTSTCAASYASQTLTVAVNPSAITVGNATTATAESTSGLKPTLSVSEKCSLGTTNNTATGVQASVTGKVQGECKVIAQQMGTGDDGAARFLPAEPVAAFVTINAAPPAPLSACEAFTKGANVIDLRASPGGQTARGVNGKYNVIYGSAFADTITGGNAGNCIDGGAGNDRLTAGAGANHLYGNDGNDTLTPASGSTAMDGGAGTDKCVRASSRANATYASCESF